MGWYPISTLVTAIINLILAGFVYFRSKRHGAVRAFALLLVAISFWCLGSFIVNISTEAKQALFWTRFLHIGAILTPAFYVHFVVEITSQKKQGFLKLVFLSTFLLLLMNLTPWFVTGVYRAEFIGWSYHAGLLYYLFGAFYGWAAVYGLVKLFIAYRKFTGYKQNQIKYFLISLLIAIFGSLIFFLLNISNAPFKVPPMDNFIVIVFTLTITYAIVAYRLVDVKVAITRLFLFFAFAVSLLVFYTALMLPLSYLVHRVFDYKYILVATGSLAITILVSPPLREGLLSYVDQLVYGHDLHYTKVIKEASSAVVTMLDTRELLGYVMETIVKDIGVKRVSLMIREGNAFKVKASQGTPLRNYIIKENSPLINWLIQNKDQAFVKYEVERDKPLNKQIFRDLEKMGAELVIPLVYKDELIGLLNLGFKASGKIYSPSDIDMLSALGTNVAVALVNARLYEEAISDSLTGLHHHKYFKARLVDELSRAQSLKYPLSLIMIDIDHFKPINDTYGHQIGDEVLRELSDIMRENTRLFDIVARYGGEEFVVLLPGIGKNGRQNHVQTVSKVAERLRKKVEEHKFTEQKLKLTVSAGVAIYNGKGKNVSPKSLIKKVDDELYRAKNEGRNRVCISSFSDLPAKLLEAVS